MTKNPLPIHIKQNIKKLDESGTKTRVSEKDLTKKIQEWQSAFDNINDAVWILNRNQRILYANRTAEKFFQLSTAEMIGKHCWEIVSCKVTRVEECPVQLAKQCRARGKKEIKVGNEWFQVTADPVLNVDGGYIGSIYIARHITVRKQAEEALREAEYKYHMLFDKMLNLFALHEIICDENGKPVDYRYLELNPAFERITGLKISDTLGKTAIEILPGIDPKLIKIYGEVALTGNPVSFEYFNIYTDQYFMITAYQPEERKFACVLQDVTEQKQAEKALRENERKLKKAHEELEQRVHERTKELWIAHDNLQKKTKKLEDVNTTISVLLEKREADKEENEEKILLNVKELMVPYVKKLKSGSITEKQKKYIGLLESGLEEIISPFTQKITSRYMNVTPRELQVANLVKNGKTSKEIAEILYITERTVVFHRTNLRKKLGLKNRSNLRTYLLSLQ